MESIYSKFYGNAQQQPFKIGAWNTAPKLRHSSSMPSIYNSSAAKPLPQLVNRTYNQPRISNDNCNVDAMKLQMLEYKLNNLENKNNELNRMNQQLTQMNYPPSHTTGYYPPAPLTGQIPGSSTYLMRQPTPMGIPTILRPPPPQMQMPIPPQQQLQLPMSPPQMSMQPQQVLIPPHQMLVPPPYYYYPPPSYENIPYDNFERRVSSHGRTNGRYPKMKKQKLRKYKLKSNNSRKGSSPESERPEIQEPDESNNNNAGSEISETEQSYEDNDEEEEEETYHRPKPKQNPNNPNRKIISKSLKILNPKQGKYFMNDIRNNLALKLQQDQFENSNNINIIQQSCNEIRSILSDKLDKIETKQRLDFENLKNALYHGGSNKLKASMLNEFNGRHYDVSKYPDFTIPEEIKNIPQLIDKKIHDFEYKKEYEKNRQERLEKEIREKVANEIKIQKYLSSIKNNSISYLPPISYEGPADYGYDPDELLQAKINVKVEEALKERDLEHIKRLENEISEKELQIKTDYLKNLKLQREIENESKKSNKEMMSLSKQKTNKTKKNKKEAPPDTHEDNQSISRSKDNNDVNKKKKQKINNNEENNDWERLDVKDIGLGNEEQDNNGNKAKKKKRKKKNKDNDNVNNDFPEPEGIKLKTPDNNNSNNNNNNQHNSEGANHSVATFE